MNYVERTAEIGRRLREARNKLGLSLRDLSELTTEKFSPARISNYEQGIRRMGIEEAVSLSAALGTVSAVYLLTLSNDPAVKRTKKAA